MFGKIYSRIEFESPRFRTSSSLDGGHSDDPDVGFGAAEAVLDDLVAPPPTVETHPRIKIEDDLMDTPMTNTSSDIGEIESLPPQIRDTLELLDSHGVLTVPTLAAGFLQWLEQLAADATAS